MNFNNSALFLEKMIEENKEDKELVKELLLAYRNLTDKTAEVNIENIKANIAQHKENMNYNTEVHSDNTNFNIENNKNNMTFDIERNKNNMTFDIARNNNDTNYNIEWNKLARLSI